MTLSRSARWTSKFVPLVVLFVVTAMFFTTALSSAQTTADDETATAAGHEVAAEDGAGVGDETDTSTEVDDVGTAEEAEGSETTDDATETTEESTDGAAEDTATGDSAAGTTEEDAIEDAGEAEQAGADSDAAKANAPSDPPGNNGTVKIDGVEFDSHPNNQPHVGCTFQVDFYGFDEGEDLNATVTFALQSPTKAGRTLTVTSGQGNPSTVFIGEDPAGGGTDVDAQETYTLAFTGAPHPIQGYHVKLTVNAEGSIGADTKHKVFWVEGCVTESPPPSSQAPSSQPPSVGPSVIPSSQAPSSAPPSQVLPSQIESEGPPPSQMLPSQQVAPSPSSDVLARRTTTAPSQLPFTGGNIVQLLAGSGLLLLTGGGLLVSSRRSRKDP